MTLTGTILDPCIRFCDLSLYFSYSILFLFIHNCKNEQHNDCFQITPDVLNMFCLQRRGYSPSSKKSSWSAHQATATALFLLRWQGMTHQTECKNGRVMWHSPWKISCYMLEQNVFFFLSFTEKRTKQLLVFQFSLRNWKGLFAECSYTWTKMDPNQNKMAIDVHRYGGTKRMMEPLIF